MSGIYQIGTGLPTTSGQAATLFIETPQSNPLDVADSGKATSPYDFYLADLASNSYSINGVNVAYVADGTMGIARYDYDITGAETSAQWNFSYYIDSTGTFRLERLHGRQHWANFGDEQLDHDQSPATRRDQGRRRDRPDRRVVNGVVELFAVTGNLGTGSSKNAVPGNKVIEVNDTGESAGYTVLATDSSDSEYRGVALSPSAVVTSSADVAAANQTISFTPPSSPIGFVPNEMVTLERHRRSFGQRRGVQHRLQQHRHRHDRRRRADRDRRPASLSSTPTRRATPTTTRLRRFNKRSWSMRRFYRGRHCGVKPGCRFDEHHWHDPGTESGSCQPISRADHQHRGNRVKRAAFQRHGNEQFSLHLERRNAARAGRVQHDGQRYHGPRDHGHQPDHGH